MSESVKMGAEPKGYPLSESLFGYVGKCMKITCEIRRIAC